MATDPDYLSVLGKYWDEQELRDLLASLGISGAPKLKRGDITGYLSSRPHGVELTFRRGVALDVPLRQYPEDAVALRTSPQGAVVLSNIRFYGKKTAPIQPFKGKLPFGGQFGASKQSLIQDLGPPEFEVGNNGPIRWDRDRYWLFAILAADETMTTF